MVLGAALIALVALRRCRHDDSRDIAAAKPTVVDERARFERVDQARRALQPNLPRYTLTGRVIDQQGRGIEGAQVVLARPARETRSAADGRFTFEGLTGGVYIVEASYRDAYAGPVKAHVAPVSSDVVLRLYPAGTLIVTVRSAIDERVIPNATVGVRMHSMFEGALDMTAQTNALGQATFAAVPGAGIEVWADARGWEYGAIPVNTAQEGMTWRATIELRPGVPLTGEVVDMAGRPVAGAIVEVAPTRMQGLADARSAVRTDAQGRFTSHGVGAGHWFVHAAHPSYDIGATEVTVADSLAPPASVRVVLGNGRTVSGLVATKDLTPVAGATVEVRWHDGGRLMKTVQADGTGAFTARGLPSEAMDLVAISERASSLPVTIDRARDDVLLVIENDQMISGVVVDASEQPIADADVFYVHEVRDGKPAIAAGVEVTGEDGRFEIVGLASHGEYVLTAMRPGHQAAVSLAARSTGIRARAGDDLTIRLPAEGTLRGRVEIDGAPATSARVQLGGSPQPVGPGGVFEIRGVPPDLYDVTAVADGCPEMTRPHVEIVAGKVTDIGAIHLSRGRIVSGRVTSSDGSSVVGAEIAFTPVGIPGRLEATTDGRGRYRRAIPTDRDVTIVASAGEAGETEPRRIAAGHADVVVDFRFAAPGGVEGVITRAGAPVGELPVLLNRKEDGGPALLMLEADVQGRFHFPKLAAGSYLVSVMEPAQPPARERYTDRRVVVEAGVTVRVDFALPAN